jgi:MFS family permease
VTEPGLPASSSGDDGSLPPELRLLRWNDPAVLAIAVVALASGFGQFGAVAALGDVAKGFGQVNHGATIADQAGLSGTALGIGLAVIRLASLAALPIAGLADRWGRRPLLLGSAAVGLALTATASLSPTYWWFIVIFACGRPMLSATNAVAEVSAAEQTGKDNRAKAVALVAAGYGVGAGLTAFLHGLFLGVLGFRGLFALALIPLLLLPVVSRHVTEPDRFGVEAAKTEHPVPVLGAVGPAFRGRLAVVAAIAFSLSLVTGPATSFIFLYAQNILHVPGYATAAMVVGAGVAGLAGLVLGQWLADHSGRRPAVSIGIVGLGCFGLVSYTGSTAALLLGYILGVLAGSVLAPGIGALLNELFPTSVRSSVSGWWVAAGVIGAAAGLVTFGAVADVGDHFGLAATVIFLPASIAVVVLLRLLPETRGREPEQVWP